MAEKIAFIIPSTSNEREWTNFNETYLNRIIGKTIPKIYNIKLFVGYNEDDKLYSKLEERVDSIDNILIEWVSFTHEYKGNPCSIWNSLGDIAVGQGYEYLMVLGDDISMPENPDWLWIFINKLKDNNNIGYSAGWSNNDQIPTQFLIHKKHIEIFKFIYPPQIRNWQCDNFLYELYGKKGNWLKEYHLLNVGGKPRYTPDNCIKLKEILVKKHRKNLFKYLNKNKYLD
tara:strand:- start:500 stop:1186 length:687 start_codon:yes stop_codon:yes gene_type:complete